MTALWSVGPCSRFSRVGPCSQSQALVMLWQPEKRRRAAALQNVGMPTFKVILEVGYWDSLAGLGGRSGRSSDRHGVGA